MRQERERAAQDEELNKRSRIRIAIEEAANRRQIREWVSLVGEDGLDAAVRQARKRLHPDVGGNNDDFVKLTLLSEWMKKEMKKGPLGFRIV